MMPRCQHCDRTLMDESAWAYAAAHDLDAELAELIEKEGGR